MADARSFANSYQSRWDKYFKENRNYYANVNELTEDSIKAGYTYNGYDLYSMAGTDYNPDNNRYTDYKNGYNATSHNYLYADIPELQKRMDYADSYQKQVEAAMSYKGYNLYSMSDTGYIPDNSVYEQSENKYLSLKSNQSDMDFRKKYVDTVIQQKESEANIKALEEQTRAIEAANAERERQSLLAMEKAKAEGASPGEAMDVSAAKTANKRRLIKSDKRKSLLNQNETSPIEKSLLGS